MLNRRYLRIKVMQALYAFIQSPDKDMAKGEKNLHNNISKIYDLYIHLLMLLGEIRDHAANTLEEAKNKHLPTPADINPNTRFIDNVVFKQLAANRNLEREIRERKISWQGESEMIKKIFQQIRDGESFKSFLASSDTSYKTQRDLIINIYSEFISGNETLEYYFEEKNIYWVDDIDFVNAMVIKTISALTESSDENTPLMKLYKDEEDDKKFMVDLFRKTILNDEESEKFIGEKTKNWEMDRIAMMDVLLMKMAITEILNFNNIPVKVSLNEYIEISKEYSTPKSKIFINGILDKLVADFKANDTIKKVGRGLME